MGDAVVCFAVIAGWFAFNGIVAAALTYCAPGDRLWRRTRLEPADGGQNRHHSEEDTTILRMFKPT
jgi:hypothetical protein